MSLEFCRCIVCLKPIGKQDPPEHVIPESLGGRLKHTLLCSNCNHNTGAKLYSIIKYDVNIRKAVIQMRKELPKIFKSVENQQEYSTKSPTGAELTAKRTHKGINIVPIIKNGEIILPTSDAINYMKKHLITSHGVSPKKALEITSKIKQAPNDIKLKLHDNLSYIRWDGDSFKPNFRKNKMCDNSAMVLMAYEYMSLLLGNSIYDEAFNVIRKFIMQEETTDNIRVHFYTSHKPQPFHLIYPEFLENKTVINIHLFEYMIAKVEFVNIHISNSPDFCYLEDLIERLSYGSLSVLDGKANQWRIFNN